MSVMSISKVSPVLTFSYTIVSAPNSEVLIQPVVSISPSMPVTGLTPLTSVVAVSSSPVEASDAAVVSVV